MPQTGLSASDASCLISNLNSLSFDFVARQKMHGINLSWYLLEQLPIIIPADYDRPFGAMTARWHDFTTRSRGRLRSLLLLRFRGAENGPYDDQKQPYYGSRGSSNERDKDSVRQFKGNPCYLRNRYCLSEDANADSDQPPDDQPIHSVAIRFSVFK